MDTLAWVAILLSSLSLAVSLMAYCLGYLHISNRRKHT